MISLKKNSGEILISGMNIITLCFFFSFGHFVISIKNMAKITFVSQGKATITTAAATTAINCKTIG